MADFEPDRINQEIEAYRTSIKHSNIKKMHLNEEILADEASLETAEISIKRFKDTISYMKTGDGIVNIDEWKFTKTDYKALLERHASIKRALGAKAAEISKIDTHLGKSERVIAYWTEKLKEQQTPDNVVCLNDYTKNPK